MSKEQHEVIHTVDRSGKHELWHSMCKEDKTGKMGRYRTIRIGVCFDADPDSRQHLAFYNQLRYFASDRPAYAVDCILDFEGQDEEWHEGYPDDAQYKEFEVLCIYEHDHGKYRYLTAGGAEL